MLKKLKEKGQASFEFLLITLFILIVTLLVLNAWFSISDETNAILFLKTKTVEKLNQADQFYALRKIEIDASQSTPENLYLTVFITPATFKANESALASEIEGFGSELAAKTKYDSVNVEIYAPQ